MHMLFINNGSFMLNRVLIATAVIVGGFLLYVAMKPADYRFSRQILIHAPPEAIFPYGNNAKKMNSWNPWMRMDPDIVIMQDGPEEGVGAITKWKGNKQVGSGTATIIESIPNTRVRIALDYQEPFAGSSVATFELKPEGDQTLVTWSNEGKSAFMMRAILVFFDMDKMMNSIFDKGLANLKAEVEAQQKPPAKAQ